MICEGVACIVNVSVTLTNSGATSTFMHALTPGYGCESWKAIWHAIQDVLTHKDTTKVNMRCVQYFALIVALF